MPPLIMSYTQKTIDIVAEAPKTLGNQLGRWAIYRDFSVLRISKITGATRQSVYNWFSGREVFPAYRPIIDALIQILRANPDPEIAYQEACKKFNINP